jgi:hypothetical protein
MSYIKPENVISPKRNVTVIHVLYDGGPGPGSYSLALGFWTDAKGFRSRVLLARWNGTPENPIGNPQSRGLATWFVLPDDPDTIPLGSIR